MSMQNKPLTIHLLANAHIDPVWLWDWREGLNEGIQTCRTVLDLMDENPRLTFVRGESVIYEHIEKYDPVTFDRICKQVAAGRWDVVGGTAIQPDNVMPVTEALIRQFVVGQRYFKKTFGKTVRSAWSADSFGHSAGMPEIIHAAQLKLHAAGESCVLVGRRERLPCVDLPTADLRILLRAHGR